MAIIESTLFAWLLFGCIGSAAFLYGKKQGSMAHMILGALLMGYPYLVSTVLPLYAVGVALTVALFIFKA